MKRFCIFLIAIITAQLASAQYFTWGTESAQQWKEHSTPRLNLIFPESFTADTAFISYFDSAIVYQTHVLPAVPRKLNIVLHPNTLISNGFVAWAPARSELFTVPARDFYPGYWPQQLAWHEMRHFAQYSVAQKQLKKRIGWVFGEYLTVGMMGIVVPSWFIEGDATASETSFMKTGRGRSPSFSSPFFAWLNSRKRLPDYDRCVLGSYQNYSPNQYLYGYWMLAKGQQQYGSAFWPNVYAETFMKGNFGMFPRTFKQATPDKLALHRFHNQTMQTLNDSVQKDLSTGAFTLMIPVTNTSEYSTYRPLGVDSAGNVIAYKKEMHGEPCFVRIASNGREKVIHSTNYIHDESFGFDGRYILYSEFRPHERREMIDFARPTRLDCITGKTVVFSKNYKELLHTTSPDGTAFASCSYESDGTYHVSAYDSETGQKLAWAKFRYSEQPVSMAIDNNAHFLYAVIQTPTDRRLVKFNSSAITTEVLFSSPDKNIGNIEIIEGFIYFDSDLNGNEEIYRIPVSGGQPECITNTMFGAYFPISDHKGGLLFSELTDNGYQIRRLAEIKQVQPEKRWEFMYNLADTLSAQTAKMCDSLKFETAEIADAKPYQQGKHLIHIHSWGPFSIDPSAGTVNPGIQFDSQNMLSTLTASVFSGYNLSTATVESGFRATYQGWYPVISAGFTNYLPLDSGIAYKFYNSVILSAYAPLVYTKNAWTFRITPEIETRPWCAIDAGDTMLNYTRHAAYLSLSASKYTNSYNLYPKLGAFFGGGALWQSFDNHKGLLIAGIGGVWLPGGFRHDGFRLRAGYELRDTLALPFSTMMTAPRGYGLISNPAMAFASAEYACPLLYPDMHIGSLIYMKRISAMVSCDYGLSPESKAFSAAGIHLMADMHFLRLFVPVRLVFSEYYLEPTHDWQFQFGFNYDLYAY